MTKRANSTSEYLVTPSLLNAWGYMWECEKTVREAESDTVCLEDKIGEAREKAFDDFLLVLRREHTEPNEYMLRGIEFEKDCYDGKTCVSPIIEGGCYQAVGKKHITVDGVKFLMYGRLDVIKGGVIYDIKRVSRYTLGKYKGSYQHGFYLELFPTAYKFEYLAFDGEKLHRERYYPSECKPTSAVISEFMAWLKQNGLFDIYVNKWLTTANK